MLRYLTGPRRALAPRLYEELREALASGRESLLVLVPEQYTLEAERELMDALTMDGAGLLNRCILSNSDDFFRIWPGSNVISWGVGSGDEEENGSISKIIIMPRWRWI